MTLMPGPDHLPPPLVYECPTDGQALDFPGDYLSDPTVITITLVGQ